MGVKEFGLAIWDTILEMGPSLLGKISIPYGRRLVKNHFPRPVGSPWLSARVCQRVRMRKFRINSVTSKTQSMPKEFEGHMAIDRVIVYHEADVAGPHVEAYLVIGGQAYNIGVKNLRGRDEILRQIKTNSRGELTKASQEVLLETWRSEFQNRAWLAQSTDHTPKEARSTWFSRGEDPHVEGGYGAGEMRQVLLDSKVDLHRVGRTSDGGVTIEWRDWDINPKQDSYVFCIMKKNEKRKGNMLSLGFKKEKVPQLAGKLKLKPHNGEEEWGRFQRRIGPDGLYTVKEDGAATHFEFSRKGARFWSHRESKGTSDKISYTGKVRDLRHVKTETKYVGMGELLYIDTRTGRQLEASEIAGILNSNKPVPEHLEPDFMIYRIDKVGRKNWTEEPYSIVVGEIERLTNEIGDNRLRPPTRVNNLDWKAHVSKLLSKEEGLVGTPEGRSIIAAGAKFKIRPELQDGIIESITFKPGRKGGIEGVIWYTDDKTGKRHKTSSGFTHEQKLHMMENKEEYKGTVMVLSHYKGHAARAAKFEHFHESKGREVPGEASLWQGQK